MKRRKTYLPLIVLIISLLLLGYILFNYSPAVVISIKTLSISILWIFFIIVFFSLSSLLYLFLRSITYSTLCSLCVVIFLLLRLNHLANPFFVVLLLAVFSTFAFVFNKRSK